MRQTRNETTVKILRETHRAGRLATASVLHPRARAPALLHAWPEQTGENIHNDDKRGALKKPGEI
jgi:hypothetical protein